MSFNDLNQPKVTAVADAKPDVPESQPVKDAPAKAAPANEPKKS